MPDYVVRTPGEIPRLLEFIERSMAKQAAFDKMSSGITPSEAARATA